MYNKLFLNSPTLCEMKTRMYYVILVRTKSCVKTIEA